MTESNFQAKLRSGFIPRRAQRRTSSASGSGVSAFGSACRAGKGTRRVRLICALRLARQRVPVFHRLVPKATPIRWLDTPEQQDYPAAQSYLELIFEAAVAAKCVKALEAAAMT